MRRKAEPMTIPHSGEGNAVEQQHREHGHNRIAGKGVEQGSGVQEQAGESPDEVGCAKQCRRKFEHGDALRRQILVIGRFGRPEVERQRVLDRCPFINSVAVGNGEPCPAHPL